MDDDFVVFNWGPDRGLFADELTQPLAGKCPYCGGVMAYQETQKRIICASVYTPGLPELLKSRCTKNMVTYTGLEAEVVLSAAESLGYTRYRVGDIVPGVKYALRKEEDCGSSAP